MFLNQLLVQQWMYLRSVSLPAVRRSLTWLRFLVSVLYTSARLTGYPKPMHVPMILLRITRIFF